MTLPASAQPFGSRLPSVDERAAANHLRTILARQVDGPEDRKLRVVDEKGETAEIVLVPAISQLLMELLRHVGGGDAVTLVPLSQMLTTQQAADILNVSRPYLVSLIDKGAIQHEMVGRHRRIRAADLFKYKTDRDARRAKALADLAAGDADYI